MSSEELEHSETWIINSGTSSESAFGGALEHAGLRLVLHNTGYRYMSLGISASGGGRKKLWV